MKAKNYYHILGVHQDVGADEIKHAYRKLAQKFHPDVSDDPDSENKFKEIGEAYETLKVPARREAYDRRAYSSPGRRTRERSMDQTMDDWPIIYVYAWWSGILWINCWYWWLNPEIWQADKGNL